MKNKKWVQILVPALICVVIGGMWMVKNRAENTTDDTSTPQSGIVLPDELKGADFGLRETEAVDFAALSGYGLPILVDYGADACIPCKAMAPVLEKANKDLQGKAFVKFINVWDYPNAVNNVPVQVIPTQVLFSADGTPFVPSDELSKEIQFDLYYHKTTGEHIFTVHQGGLNEEQMWAILKEMGAE